MRDKSGMFSVNAHKASSRMTINSFMIGGLFVILTIIWTLSPERFGLIILSQLVLAIPFLFLSILFYIKSISSDEYGAWDAFAWFTNNVGNIFVLNAIGLMTAIVYPILAIMYFCLTVILMSIYSFINVRYEPESAIEKLFKFLFFVFVMILGGIFPVIM